MKLTVKLATMALFCISVADMNDAWADSALSNMRQAASGKLFQMKNALKDTANDIRDSDLGRAAAKGASRVRETVNDARYSATGRTMTNKLGQAKEAVRGAFRDARGSAVGQAASAGLTRAGNAASEVTRSASAELSRAGNAIKNKYHELK